MKFCKDCDHYVLHTYGVRDFTSCGRPIVDVVQGTIPKNASCRLERLSEVDGCGLTARFFKPKIITPKPKKLTVLEKLIRWWIK